MANYREFSFKWPAATQFFGTKESFYTRKVFKSHRIGLERQHDRRFIVLGYQHGCRDLMLILSIELGQWRFSIFTQHITTFLLRAICSTRWVTQLYGLTRWLAKRVQMLRQFGPRSLFPVSFFVRVGVRRTGFYKYITIFRKEATLALAGFHAGPLSWSNWNLKCWFLWRNESRRTWRKTLGARTEPTSSTHIWHQAGIERRPHWWEASALTTVPSLLHMV